MEGSAYVPEGIAATPIRKPIMTAANVRTPIPMPRCKRFFTLLEILAYEFQIANLQFHVLEKPAGTASIYVPRDERETPIDYDPAFALDLEGMRNWRTT